MDKRLGLIIAVCIVEVIFRAFYDFIRIDPLLYTFIARSVEMGIILALAWKDCGITTGSVRKEVLVGFGIALAFALAVILTDLVSRIALAGGVLKLLLARQHIENPVGFFLVGCLFAPLAEELFFRGLVYTWLRQRLPLIAAIAVSALMFASVHGFLSPVQLIGGILFAGIFEWRRSIWAPYIVHVLANFGIWVFPLVCPF